MRWRRSCQSGSAVPIWWTRPAAIAALRSDSQPFFPQVAGTVSHTSAKSAIIAQREGRSEGNRHYLTKVYDLAKLAIYLFRCILPHAAQEVHDEIGGLFSGL